MRGPEPAPWEADMSSRAPSTGVAALVLVVGAACSARNKPAEVTETRSALTCGHAAVAVTTGDDFACALLDDGTVQCWGGNDYGQLGNGTTTGAMVPTIVPGLTGVTAIAAGEYHACAVQSGAVKCWGANFTGQVGNGTITSSAPQRILPPVAVPGLTTVAAVTAGYGHT